jgi:hypothetical protein
MNYWRRKCYDLSQLFRSSLEGIRSRRLSLHSECGPTCETRCSNWRVNYFSSLRAPITKCLFQYPCDQLLVNRPPQRACLATDEISLASLSVNLIPTCPRFSPGQSFQHAASTCCIGTCFENTNCRNFSDSCSGHAGSATPHRPNAFVRTYRVFDRWRAYTPQPHWKENPARQGINRSD